MKRNLCAALTVLLVTTSLQLNAQYGDLGIRQKFDEVYESMHNNWTDGWDYTPAYGEDSNNPVLQQELGNRAGSLEALLIMYEATCDRDYLLEFMRRMFPIMTERGDFWGAVPDYSGYMEQPIWFKDNMALHGRLLHPFSHFVRLIEESNIGWLTPETDPANPDEFGEKVDVNGNPDPNGAYLTYAQQAAHLNESNIRCMDYLIDHFWRSNNECFCRPVSSSAACPGGNDDAIRKYCTDSECSLPGGSEEVKSITELGMQAPLGCAFIYMYLSNPGITDYGVHAVEMARAYLIEDGGILDYNAANNAYTWHHDGWQAKRADQNSPWIHETENIEDITYGSIDISFPVLYNKYYDDITGPITGNQYFEDYQMVRFRNTFTRLIYRYNVPNVQNTYIYGTTFYMNVNGSNTATSTYPNPLQSVAQSSAKGWISLYKFDDVSGAEGNDDVYNILMDFYIAKEAGYAANDANFGGIKIIALAQLCAANYAKEGIVTAECDPDPNAPDPDESGRHGRSALVYPNPAEGQISISLMDQMKEITGSTEVSILITTVSGKVVLKTQKTSNIDVSTFPKGVYFIEITTPNDTWKKTLTLK